MIKISATGRVGENKWDERGRDSISQIFISHGKSDVKGIQFQFVGPNGNLVLSEPHGFMSAPQFHTVKLNHPSEYITRVSGYSNNMNGITSIEFGTNKTTHGPFGCGNTKATPGPFGHVRENNLRFEFHLGQNCQFGGFHGSNDNSKLTSIGVYLKPATTLNEVNQAVNQVKLERR